MGKLLINVTAQDVTAGFGVVRVGHGIKVPLKIVNRKQSDQNDRITFEEAANGRWTLATLDFNSCAGLVMVGQWSDKNV